MADFRGFSTASLAVSRRKWVGNKIPTDEEFERASRAVRDEWPPDENSNTIEEQIKEDIANIEKLVSRYGMEETGKGNFTMGMYRIYKNKNIAVRYINERGFGLIEIGAALQSNNLLCVDFFKDLYEPRKSRWRLSVKEQLKFIKKNYKKMLNDLSESNYASTFNKIEIRLNEI